MKRTFSRTILLATLTFATALVFAQKPKPKPRPVPKIIETATVKSPEQRTSETRANYLGVVYEKLTADISVNSDGTSTAVFASRARAKDPSAVYSLSQFYLPYNSGVIKIEVLTARIIKPNGTIIETPKEKIIDRPSKDTEAAPAFFSLREIAFSFDNLKIGDVIELKVKHTIFRTYFENEFSFFKNFPPTFEWTNIEVNASAPIDREIFFDANGLEGGAISPIEGRNRWQWRRSRIEPVPIESYLVDINERSPYIALTTIRDFAGLGRAYWANAQKQAIVSPELQALADEITRGITDPKLQAEAIYSWVNKNIRYILVLLDRGGWIPHNSADIVSNRYGDCKDYSILLHTLLKAKNIDSQPVLIRSDFSPWFPNVPVMEFFNHAILYIPILGKFADATVPSSRIGLLAVTLASRRAVLAGASPGLIETPAGNPDSSVIRAEVDIEIAENGDLVSRAKNTFAGTIELMMRPMFADARVLMSSDNFGATILAMRGITGTGKLVRVSDPFATDTPLVGETEFRIPGYVKFDEKQPLSLPPVFNLVNVLDLEAIAREESRKSGLPAGAQTITETITVKLPPGRKIGKLPEPFEIVNKAASFKVRFESTEGKIVIRREMKIFHDIIKSEDYPGFKEVLGKVRELQQTGISIISDDSAARNPSNTAVVVPQKRTEPISGGYGDPFLDAWRMTPADAAKIEAQLVKKPDDVQGRIRLLRYYYRDPRIAPAMKKKRIEHRIWLIKNRPELTEWDMLEFSGFDSEADAVLVRDEWLKQVALDPKNVQIVLNAAKAVSFSDRDAALNILRNARRDIPDEYLIEFEIAKLSEWELNALQDTSVRPSTAVRTDPAKIAATRDELIEAGMTALELIGKERSKKRSEARIELLILLVPRLFEKGEFAKVKTLCTELTLDFDSAAFLSFEDDAIHIGNIYLGRIYFREGNIEKAKEHLLIAIRGPLRTSQKALDKIDLALAGEMLGAGERDTVLEYLRLSEGLRSLGQRGRQIQLWQQQIKAGKTPILKFNQ